jgi:hypothetical protein
MNSYQTFELQQLVGDLSDDILDESFDNKTQNISIIKQCLAQKYNHYICAGMIILTLIVILNVILLINTINYINDYWFFILACTLSIICDIVVLLIININYSQAVGIKLYEHIDNCIYSWSVKKCVIFLLILLSTIKSYVYWIVFIIYFNDDRTIFENGYSKYVDFNNFINSLYFGFTATNMTILLIVVCYISIIFKKNIFDLG